MTEDLEDLLNLFIAPVDRGDLVLTGKEVQVGREVLQERRQLEPLAEPLFAQFVVAHPGGDSRHEHLRLDAMTADDGYRHPLAFFENRREQIGRLDRLTAGPARLVE